MREQQITITKPLIDNAAVAAIVQCAGRFSSDVTIYASTRRINAKSLMGMIGMGFKRGESVIIRADGTDEAEAIEALAKQFS